MVILGGTPFVRQVRQVRQTCRPLRSARRNGYPELVGKAYPVGFFWGVMRYCRGESGAGVPGDDNRLCGFLPPEPPSFPEVPWADGLIEPRSLMLAAPAFSQRCWLHSRLNARQCFARAKSFLHVRLPMRLFRTVFCRRKFTKNVEKSQKQLF